jgi:hypothetical protein
MGIIIFHDKIIDGQLIKGLPGNMQLGQGPGFPRHLLEYGSHMIIFFFVAVAGGIFIEPIHNFQVIFPLRNISYPLLYFPEISFVPLRSLSDAGIKMGIAKSVDKCLGHHICLLRNDLGKCRITGNIKRDTQKLVATSLV